MYYHSINLLIGITFGRLWVAVKCQDSEQWRSTKLRQDIPLRGTILEGASFYISEKRIQFKSQAMAFDSDEESDDDSSTSHRVSLRKPSLQRFVVPDKDLYLYISRIVI
jgi:hypothetical protein